MEKVNPFKQIGLPSKEIPKELKQKVMNEVASVKLLRDIAIFYTSNYRNTLVSLFLTKKKVKKATNN